MVQASRHTGFNVSPLIRLLSRLTHIDVRESKQPTADRLGQWLSWTDAISLSGALNGNPAAALPAARSSSNIDERECARVRAALVNAIGAPASHREPVDSTVDFAPYRQRYLAKQQAMAAGIDSLRQGLRAALAARSPDMARLAAVDAAMEQALYAHEHSLLASVPKVLERHFKRLRQAEQAVLVDAAPPDHDEAADRSGAWLDVFRKDFHDALLAELDFRFQPVEGLLDALRTKQPG